MTDIIAGIDAYMTQKYGDVFACKFYGFCELAKRTNQGSEQPMPLTINGTHKREQVAIDDRYQLVTWIRVPSQATFGTNIDDADWGFGLDSGNVATINLRMVVAYKVELGETLIIDIANGIPSIINNSNYELISVSRGGIIIDFDHEAIYNTELGAGQYEKHRTAWNLYVINIPVQYIQCD